MLTVDKLKDSAQMQKRGFHAAQTTRRSIFALSICACRSFSQTGLKPLLKQASSTKLLISHIRLKAASPISR